jgi:hypothetical protein
MSTETPKRIGARRSRLWKRFVCIVSPLIMLLAVFVLAADAEDYLRPLPRSYPASAGPVQATPKYYLTAPFVPRPKSCLKTHQLHGGFGQGVPRFHWGYFGAGRYRQGVSHTGYYGDYAQWSFRWGP